jgi:hypothetical protein
VKSVAHFFSAIHNAHYGQPPAILTYHCRQAVVYSDAIRELMLQYIDFSTRQCNTLLCRSFEQIMLDSSAEQYSGGMALKHPRDQKLLDVELVQAMVEAIGATGTDAGNAVQRLLIKEHAIGEREKSLLQSQYCLASYNAFALNPQPGYFQARSIQSRFSFVSDGEGVLRFRLVYRTPGKGSGDQRIIVRINGSAAAIGEMPLVDSWARYTFSIDARLIHTGLNRLTIDWPYPQVPMAGPERLTGNSFLDMLFPVLGEIWSFTAIRSQADA